MEEMTEEKAREILSWDLSMGIDVEGQIQQGRAEGFLSGLAQGRKEAEILVKALKQIQDKDCDCSAPDTCGYCLTVCNMIAEEALALEEYRAKRGEEWKK